MNYLVGDFIIRIKNASLARRKHIDMPFSNINKEIGSVLVKEGFLADIKEEERDGKRMLTAEIRYENRKPAVTHVTVVSKPSLRVYMTAKDIAHHVTREAMTSIISTSMGVMSGKDAIKKRVGGELLFKIW